MAGLTIGWEYLTGYAVATDPSSRDRAEWPPHPARVFMAMAAAWFETDPGEQGSAEQRGEHAAEGEALRWLERLGDPELWLPPVNIGGERSNVTVYVPVNDKAGPSSASLQSAPALTRNKQGRTFPRRYVGNMHVFLRWVEAEGIDKHRDALARVCAKVTRIGHSSSLVWMWVAERDVEPEGTGLERWQPGDGISAIHCRRISPGFLSQLDQRFGEKPRMKKATLGSSIEELEAEKKGIKGKGSKARKAEVDDRLAPLREEFKRTLVHEPVRPHVGLWTGYRRADASTEPEVSRSRFDTDLLILKHESGPRLPLVSTLAVCEALRGAVMQHCPVPVPEWVSGHKPDGSPSEEESGHMAILPLPFVGHGHADGHLLGLAVAFPRGIDRRERGRVLGPLIVTENGEPKAIALRRGRLGVWTLGLGEWEETRQTLMPETWTTSPHGARVWASATPIVLDRFPKADRLKNRSGWEEEVAAIIAGACERVGLPRPAVVDIDTTSWHVGSPRAVCKRRRLRGQDGGHAGETSLGDGFPAYPAKGTRSARPQVHVWIEFDEPVVGPVLLGAGRYRGYGLCKPIGARTGARP